MFNKYYQDELTFLRDMGREFSQAYPALAHMLAERGSDPDVERLLEGFAFLAGRIRQKLDDEFPEVTHGLLNLLWPHYLRPIPSTSIIQFKPVPGAVRDKARIARGTEVASVPVEGTRCRFRTCSEVELFPFELESVETEERAGTVPALRLAFLLGPGTQFKQLGMGSLRLFLWGDPELTGRLYLWFCRNLERVIFQGYIEGHPTQQLSLPASSVKPAGFAEEESLLPYPQRSFAGFRLLQEYFTIPSKFLFFDVTGLAPTAALDTGGKFELRFEFKRSPQALPRVAPENFRLFCTPVINLFPHTADPIRLEHDRVEYRIRPASVEARHYEVYSTDRVQGWAEGRVKPKEYAPFYTFTHDIGAGREPVFYLTRLRPSVSSEGTDTFISFVSAQEENVLPEAETISIDLTCANRDLPHHLRIGDISVPTGESPEFAVFQNIVRVTTSIRPPLDRGLHWRLLSHLSLNYISLASPEALRSVLELYNFQALYDRQAARENQLRLEAIQGVRSKPMDWLMKGIPVHGTSVELDLMETNFSGEGDLYLFAAILNEVFALYSSINSFTKLKVRGVKQNEVYEWAPRLGRQILA